jgi:hypothetical protein
VHTTSKYAKDLTRICQATLSREEGGTVVLYTEEYEGIRRGR